MNELTEQLRGHTPLIIAQGPNKLAISQYFIYVDGDYINIPIEYKFAQVVDLLIKVYFIFNISYDTDLSQFLNYIQIYFYKIVGPKATTRMVEIYTKINSKIKAN